MPLLILFILVPIVEIYLFIELGGWIGAGWTIVSILITALVGVFFVKQQGISLLFNAQKKMEANKVPAGEMFAGVCVLVAGLLLLTPGFFTDGIGFLLLWPAFRGFLKTSILDSILGAYTFGFVDTDTVKWGKDKAKEKYQKMKGSNTIEGDFTVVDSDDDLRQK